MCPISQAAGGARGREGHFQPRCLLCWQPAQQQSDVSRHWVWDNEEASCWQGTGAGQCHARGAATAPQAGWVGCTQAAMPASDTWFRLICLCPGAPPPMGVECCSTAGIKYVACACGIEDAGPYELRSLCRSSGTTGSGGKGMFSTGSTGRSPVAVTPKPKVTAEQQHHA